MIIRKLALIGALVSYGGPVLAQSHNLAVEQISKPKPLTTLEFGGKQIELTAVTARARADTRLRRDYLSECRNMAKVTPGYPQPAVFSVDVKLKF